MIPDNSYFIEIALIKKIFIILTQYTNNNIELIFTEKNIYIYTYNEYSYLWIIIDDLFGDINFLKKINFKKRTFIQLSNIDLMIILRDLLDSRRGHKKFIKIGSTDDYFIINDKQNKYENKYENMKIFMPPILTNYNIEDARYGNKENYYKIIDNLLPDIISELGYNPIMYNNTEISIVSHKFTLLSSLIS